MKQILIYAFGEDLIKNVSCFIEENFISKGRELSRLAIVFGGKRPSLFLKKELAEKIKKPFFSPRFFTIDEFAEYLACAKAPIKMVNDLDAAFIIHRLLKDVSGNILEGKENFAKFLPWGREILSFIEQFDLEGLDKSALDNIKFNAEIGYDVPENINQLLEYLMILREKFHDYLRENDLYTRGIVYRTAAGAARKNNLDEFEEIMFCGLFYLNKSEKEIIKNFYERKKAILVFQGDEQDWQVLREDGKVFACRIEPSMQESNPRQDFSVCAGIGLHSQVCLVRELLKKTGKPEKTVIVCPQGETIVPLLSEIAAMKTEFNVSMGYPLERSPLCAIFNFIFKAQAAKKGEEYYVKDYLRVLNHPFAKNLKIASDPALTRVLIHKTEEVLLGTAESPLAGSVFVKLEDLEKTQEIVALARETLKNMDMAVQPEDLLGVLRFLHELLFKQWEDVASVWDFSLRLERLLEVLTQKSFMDAYPLNLSAAEKIFQIKDEFKNSVFNRESFSREEIFKIFEYKLENELISFSGSPLKGLQVLGLFETRALSFENVIVLDANESILPKLRIHEPLIPREVMLQLGLNHLEREEQIQRYHFMRLLSCARKVALVYDSSQNKERSRFIEELIWDRQKQSRALDVAEVSYGAFRVKALPKKISVNKTPGVIAALKELTFSASSVDTYLYCPLRFYYKYVLKLEEKEELAEEPEGADIGKFIHSLLEEAFKNFEDREFKIDDKFRKHFFGLLDRRFDESFAKRMKADAFLLKKIIGFRMENFLDKEAKRDVKRILSLERRFDDKIVFEAAAVKFTARVDRVDELTDGRVLIIDYKTGSVELKPKGLNKLQAMEFDRGEIKNSVVSFQLPLYYYLLRKIYARETLLTALYYLRDSTLDYYPAEKKSQDVEPIIDICLKALGAMVTEILKPSVPFIADETDDGYCQTCPFTYLCR